MSQTALPLGDEPSRPPPPPRPSAGDRPTLVVEAAQALVDALTDGAWELDPELAALVARLQAVLPDGDPLPDDHEATEYLTYEAGFTYAKTVPDAPHEYLLLSRASDPLHQLRLIDLIRRTGSPGSFRGWRYAYRTWGDWTYWASPPAGRPPAVADSILNRRRA
jgi:hypothetical protein